MVNPKDVSSFTGEVTIKIHSKGRFKHLKKPLNKDVWVFFREGGAVSASFDTTEEALNYLGRRLSNLKGKNGKKN